VEEDDCEDDVQFSDWGRDVGDVCLLVMAILVGEEVPHPNKREMLARKC
jgi:hypothetical protein